MENKNIESSHLIKIYESIIQLLSNHYQHYQGRFFTFIDALTEDEKRRKALKDLLREILIDQDNSIRRIIKYRFVRLAREIGDEEFLKIIERRGRQEEEEMI